MASSWKGGGREGVGSEVLVPALTSQVGSHMTWSIVAFTVRCNNFPSMLTEREGVQILHPL